MFPELVNEDDEEFARKYILNNIIERIIYKDLPEDSLSIRTWIGYFHFY